MEQKVIKIGSSIGVTLSKKLLADLGLQVGDRIKIGVDKKGGSAIITPAEERVDKELMEWTKGFIKRYEPALRELSKK